MAAMASASSLASQQFSGLRRSFSVSSSTNALFFENTQSQIRFSTSRRAPRGVVAMAGSGKFFVGGNWKCNGTKESISKLVSDLNDAKLENDVEILKCAYKGMEAMERTQ